MDEVSQRQTQSSVFRRKCAGKTRPPLSARPACTRPFGDSSPKPNSPPIAFKPRITQAARCQRRFHFDEKHTEEPRFLNPASDILSPFCGKIPQLLPDVFNWLRDNKLPVIPDRQTVFQIIFTVFAEPKRAWGSSYRKCRESLPLDGLKSA